MCKPIVIAKFRDIVISNFVVKVVKVRLYGASCKKKKTSNLRPKMPQLGFF